MKQPLTLFVFFVTVHAATLAQIPNASFENWTPGGGGAYNDPDGWHTFNFYTDANMVYTCEKGTSGAPHGSSFIKLTTKMINSNAIPGIAMCSRYDFATQKPKSGFPFTGRPSHLTGKWQYMAMGTDTGRIAVYLTKWNTTTGQRDMVGSFEYDLPGMVMSWTSFAIPLTYTSGVSPDTAIIGMASSNKSSNAVAGSYLYVDSLNFTGNVPDAVYDIRGLKYSVTLLPNPATDKLSVDFGATVTDDVSLSVIDMYGRVVTAASFDRGQRVYSVDLNTVTPGAYFVKLSLGEEVQTQRLVVQ